MAKQNNDNYKTVKQILLKWVVLLPALFYLHILLLSEKYILPLILHNNHSAISSQNMLSPAVESIILNFLLLAWCIFLIFKIKSKDDFKINATPKALSITREQGKILKKLSNNEAKCLRVYIERESNDFIYTKFSNESLKRLIDSDILERPGLSSLEGPDNIKCRLNKTVFEYLNEHPELLNM